MRERESFFPTQNDDLHFFRVLLLPYHRTLVDMWLHTGRCNIWVPRFDMRLAPSCFCHRGFRFSYCLS
jgi:hypothetical protein